jgi:hypothetical protein
MNETKGVIRRLAGRQWTWHQARLESVAFSAIRCQRVRAPASRHDFFLLLPSYKASPPGQTRSLAPIMSRLLCLVMIAFAFFCSVLAHPIPNDGSSLEKRSYEGRVRVFSTHPRVKLTRLHSRERGFTTDLVPVENGTTTLIILSLWRFTAPTTTVNTATRSVCDSLLLAHLTMVWQWVHITVGDKSVNAQVRDGCAACGANDLGLLSLSVE